VFKPVTQPLTLALLFMPILLAVSLPAFAAHPVDNPELENLKRRIEALEAAQSTPAETGTASEAGVNPEIENLQQRIEDLEKPEAEPTPDDLGKICEHLTLHGLLEVEASYTKPEGGDDDSDLTLATAELSLEATLNDQVGGHLTLLYEEEDGEDDSIDVDEAVISLTAPKPYFGQSGSLHAGRMYVPFGMFSSYMITDPLTLDLGETRNTAGMVALEGDLWTFKAATFNGDFDTSGDNIDTWVSSLAFILGENIRFGGSFISDLAESDIELVQDEDAYSSSVMGASAFLSLQYGAFGFIAEYLAALEDFGSAVVDVGTDLTGKRPETWNLELAWMPLDHLQVAARYEAANDFQNNVNRYGGTVSYGLFEQVVVALEFLRADADVDEDDPVNVVTAQLALEF